jgi:hypothetical protein
LMGVQGSYGADGSVYHTERETWTRVKSSGQCGGGPCYFVRTVRTGPSSSSGRQRTPSCWRTVPGIRAGCGR